MVAVTYSVRWPSDSEHRVNEVKMFWRLSSRAMTLCKGLLTDKDYTELDDLRDELDLIADKTDQPDLHKKALHSINLIDEAVKRARQREALQGAKIAGGVA